MTNTERLRELMTKYRLNSKHVSKLIHVSHGTVRAYCSASNLTIPNPALELLEFKLGERSFCDEELKNVNVG